MFYMAILLCLVGKSTSNWLYLLIFSTAIMNFLKKNNNFMTLLLSIELLAALTLIFWALNLFILNLGSSVLFMFMVMMVAEAVLSLGILITLARMKSNEMEVNNLVI